MKIIKGTTRNWNASVLHHNRCSIPSLEKTLKTPPLSPTTTTSTRCFGSSVAFCVTSFVETQAGGLFMAARGSAVRRREGRVRSWWRHEQASVRMAMITAGHHSHRKAAGIEIGVQAGAHLFDSDPNDVDVLAPVTEYVAPAPAIVCSEPAPVIEYESSAPVVECVAPAPAV